MDYPEDVRYTEQHEWGRRENGLIRVGITDYAQDALGDVVFVQLPEQGARVDAGATFSEVESTKSVSDIYAPLSGSVTGLNAECRDNPALVNQDPYGEGWLVILEPGDAGEYERLLNADQYAALVQELEGDAGGA